MRPPDGGDLGIAELRGQMQCSGSLLFASGLQVSAVFD